ncbi:stage III sporulation protein AF [Alkalihalobacillus sp. TS-13]|uniref:stage III sporulation protein AF n=1 Tax=Alkalihalobacillus sp. TS-13 TaxID=2842455 RepID=UPI001C867434|nr:stage III sporulation protein AF [Alkalihalobacillus sp. TS-13]
MSFIYEWVTNIILIILLATILELLLPSNAFQKYVKVVIGLLLIIAILNPMIKMFSVDLNQELASFANDEAIIKDGEMKNLIENKKSEIQASQDAYILEQMRVLLKQKVEDKLAEQYQKRLKDVVLQEKTQNGSDESQWIIHATLESQSEDEDAIEAIQEVTIDTSTQTEEPVEESADMKEIKTFLSKEWEVSPDQIVLVEEGGS